MTWYVTEKPNFDPSKIIESSLWGVKLVIFPHQFMLIISLFFYRFFWHSRCGDILLTVNEHCLQQITHAVAVEILRQVDGAVTLTVVSWPGTVVWQRLLYSVTNADRDWGLLGLGEILGSGEWGYKQWMLGACLKSFPWDTSMGGSSWAFYKYLHWILLS